MLWFDASFLGDVSAEDGSSAVMGATRQGAFKPRLVAENLNPGRVEGSQWVGRVGNNAETHSYIKIAKPQELL